MECFLHIWSVYTFFFVFSLETVADRHSCRTGIKLSSLLSQQCELPRLLHTDILKREKLWVQQWIKGSLATMYYDYSGEHNWNWQYWISSIHFQFIWRHIISFAVSLCLLLWFTRYRYMLRMVMICDERKNAISVNTLWVMLRNRYCIDKRHKIYNFDKMWLTSRENI